MASDLHESVKSFLNVYGNVVALHSDSTLWCQIVDAIFQQQLEPIPLLPMLYVKAYISYILYQDIKL
jgi:hypothetical protein